MLSIRQSAKEALCFFISSQYLTILLKYGHVTTNIVPNGFFYFLTVLLDYVLFRKTVVNIYIWLIMVISRRRQLLDDCDRNCMKKTIKFAVLSRFMKHCTVVIKFNYPLIFKASREIVFNLGFIFKQVPNYYSLEITFL